MTDHIVASFDEDLSRLRSTVLQLGRRGREQTTLAVRALLEEDGALAARVVEEDADLDRLEQSAEEQVVRLLALRAPVAADLRTVITALKVANSLERIGDFAANIAKRAMVVGRVPGTGPRRSLRQMTEIVDGLLAGMLTAYETSDADKAEEVRAQDAEVDQLYTSLFRELLTYMMESPQYISGSAHLLLCAKNFERIGDHATNVAENVIFLVRGRVPDDEREKRDVSSFTVSKDEAEPAAG